ncbi:DNA alkylation repair protein [Planctomycetota bacterium]|nr:DNA alkylation repair protein [Planctomycetota bacterium]
MDCEQIVKELRALAGTKDRTRQNQLGIKPTTTEHLGITIPNLRELAGQLRQQAADSHEVALQLWEQPILEARFVASMAADPDRMTVKLMNRWVKDFDSWALCDQTCNNLFVYTSDAWSRPTAWAPKSSEYIRRAGFVMISCLAVHDKRAANEKFVEFFPIIRKYATDDRNFVKKAVNWSIRGIGKRNYALNQIAIMLAEELLEFDSKTANWIARDALSELRNPRIQKRLKN